MSTLSRPGAAPTGPTRPARASASRRLAALAALVVAGAVVGAGLLAGCAPAPSAARPSAASSPVDASSAPPGPTEPTRPTGSGTPAPEAPPLTGASTAADVRAALTPHSGTWLLPLTAAVDVEDLGGSTRTTLHGGAPDHVHALVAVPEGATVDLLDDGSAVVRDAAGAAVAGIAAPAVADGGGGAVRLEAAGPELVRVVGAADGAVQVWTSDTPVVSATWTEQEGGRSLAVAPSDWSRRAGQAGLELVTAHLALLGEEATSTSMRDQLLCHLLGAPDKETWNLEPWRPDVGFLGVVAAECNPGR